MTPWHSFWPNFPLANKLSQNLMGQVKKDKVLITSKSNGQIAVKLVEHFHALWEVKLDLYDPCTSLRPNYQRMHPTDVGGPPWLVI